ncbi:MAG TPA: Mur ligase family protein, partial [Ruminococcus sp.]|nr:Mur ligase family protein [Ruminococcus sp.]
MNYEEAQNFINSFSRLGKKVNDLSRIKKLLDKLDNPQNKLNFVHIAGTNGKGSTLEYIANALQNAGYTAGKFTSPYVTHYADRIRVNSSEIDEKSIAEICGFVAERVESREFSQFEITMSIAFIYFLRQKCDVVVLETGIGGLVDSTNIIAPPLLSVITSVSYDHTAILGETLEEIAEQKAGIIRSKNNAVISVDNEEVCKDVVRKKADEMNAVLT